MKSFVLPGKFWTPQVFLKVGVKFFADKQIFNIFADPRINPAGQEKSYGMYAIVNIAGQQYKVEKDQKLFVHRLADKEGQMVQFDEVLLIDNDKDVLIGEPTIKGAMITGKVLSHPKGDKVMVFKKKKRKGYKVLRGHRQYLTEIQIQEIVEKGAPAKAKSETAARAGAKETAVKASAGKEDAPKAKSASGKAADAKAEKAAEKSPEAKAVKDEKTAPAKKADTKSKTAEGKTAPSTARKTAATSGKGSESGKGPSGGKATAGKATPKSKAKPAAGKGPGSGQKKPPAAKK